MRTEQSDDVSMKLILVRLYYHFGQVASFFRPVSSSVRWGKNPYSTRGWGGPRKTSGGKAYPLIKCLLDDCCDLGQTPMRL